MRYSATWLSMCWAATMCCPSWLVWICWAGPDGLLKALPYGIPETLHSSYRHTQTLNCYSCYCDYHYHRCYSYASFSLSMIHIVVWLGGKMFALFRRSALPSFQRYCPTGCLVCYYCISMYLVAFLCYYFRYMCNWGRMFPVQHEMVQCHYQQLICWHILSLPRNNVKGVKNHWSLSPSAFWIATVFSVCFEDAGELLSGAGGPRLTAPGLRRVNVDSHFSHTCCHCPYIPYE